MFLNRCHQPMTRSGIHALVRRCATKACAQAPSLKSKKISPHVIRHTTASHLLHAGVDINTIRGWLGHVSINTTNIYAETDLETKARALATCAVPDKTTAKKTLAQSARSNGVFAHAIRRKVMCCSATRQSCCQREMSLSSTYLSPRHNDTYELEFISIKMPSRRRLWATVEGRSDGDAWRGV